MPDFFAYLNVTVVVAFVAFVAGVVLSQKIKDWVHGVPSDLRKGLNDLEAKVRTSVADKTKTVLSTVHDAVPLPPAPAAAAPAKVDVPAPPAPPAPPGFTP